VRSQTAQFDAPLFCGPEDYAYNRRRSAGYFPCPAKAGAIGSVSDDRRGLESYGNIPLLVTLRGRDEFIGGLERAEGRLRWGGGALLFAGLFGLLVTLSTVLNFPAADGAEPRRIALGLAGAAVLFLAWLAAYLYNRLVMYRERVKTAWRHVDVDLKNRHDLVPELVETIKSYQEHERGLFSALARISAGRPKGELVTDPAQTITPLPDLGAVSERYPELKASQLFVQLQNQLTALEEKIACARRFYNDNVLAYNNARAQFPTSVIARMFPRFPVYEPFAVSETGGQEP
jgi:LemA protein